MSHRATRIRAATVERTRLMVASQYKGEPLWMVAREAIQKPMRIPNKEVEKQFSSGPLSQINFPEDKIRMYFRKHYFLPKTVSSLRKESRPYVLNELVEKAMRRLELVEKLKSTNGEVPDDVLVEDQGFLQDDARVLASGTREDLLTRCELMDIMYHKNASSEDLALSIIVHPLMASFATEHGAMELRETEALSTTLEYFFKVMEPDESANKS
eukprot:m.339314 g.339314  ORF g.339314 m.339314 type:complete len:213 (+) comp18748_c0_seq1:201-839(+)